jgi:multidrug efflux pump
VLRGADQPTLDLWSARLRAALRDEGTLRNVTTDVLADAHGLTVDVDRDAAARIGITAAGVDAALYDAFGQRIVSTIFTQADQHRVILEGKAGAITNPQALAGLYVPTGSGSQVPSRPSRASSRIPPVSRSTVQGSFLQ